MRIDRFKVRDLRPPPSFCACTHGLRAGRAPCSCGAGPKRPASCPTPARERNAAPGRRVGFAVAELFRVTPGARAVSILAAHVVRRMCWHLGAFARKADTMTGAQQEQCDAGRDAWLGDARGVRTPAASGHVVSGRAGACRVREIRTMRGGRAASWDLSVVTLWMTDRAYERASAGGRAVRLWGAPLCNAARRIYHLRTWSEPLRSCPGGGLIFEETFARSSRGADEDTGCVEQQEGCCGRRGAQTRCGRGTGEVRGASCDAEEGAAPSSDRWLLQMAARRHRAHSPGSSATLGFRRPTAQHRAWQSHATAFQYCRGTSSKTWASARAPTMRSALRSRLRHRSSVRGVAHRRRPSWLAA